MKLAINALSVTPSRGGAKTFLLNLVQRLSSRVREESLLLIVNTSNQEVFARVAPHAAQSVVGVSGDNAALRVWADQVLVPWLVRKHGVDVLISPSNSASLLAPCRQICIVHGPLAIRPLRQRYAPYMSTPIHRIYFDAIVPLSVRRADRTVVVSRNTKAWLLKQTTIAQNRIRVVYEGVDAERFRVDSSEHTETSVNVDRPYVLFVSTLFPYKNADLLIRAFAHAMDQYELPHQLIIAGRDPGSQMPKLKDLAERLGISGHVSFLGAIPHESIPSLYQAADLFVYPSTLETFGLPILEAMAAGVPVIGSDRCSVPEVIGDAGLVIDPDDIRSFAEAIGRLLRDDNLRSQLIEKGVQRAESFNWDQTARSMLQLVHEISDDAGPR